MAKNTMELQNKMMKQHAEKKNAMIAEENGILGTTMFPSALIPKGFPGRLLLALRHECPKTFNCDWPMFKSLLLTEPKNFNLNQMAMAINALDSKNMEQLNMEYISDYVTCMDDIAEMAVKWNEMVMPIRESIVKQFNSK